MNDARVGRSETQWAAAKPGASRQGRLVRLGPVLAILLLAAFLRLWALPNQPVLYFDSGLYLAEGKFLASAAERAVLALLQPSAGGPLNPLERVAQGVVVGTEAHPPDLAKPGHAILMALSMLLLGKTAFAGVLVSALAGVGTVAITYALGRLGWNRRVAIGAALLLAVSGEHLTYSREALVEADGLFFASLGSLVYLWHLRKCPSSSSRRVLVGAGLLFGLAFTCNNRLSYLPAAVAAVELSIWSQAERAVFRRTVVGRSLSLVGGFLIPLGLIEAAYLGARGIGRVTGVPTNWLDYVQQSVQFARMNPPDRFRVDEWPTFFADLALMDGPIPLILLLAGTAVVLRNRRREDLLLAGMLLVPVALYSVYSTGEVRMRHFSLALPWVMLAAAIGADWLAARLPSRLGTIRAGAGFALIAGAALLSLQRAWALASPVNGMPALIATLEERSATQVAATNGPALAFYLGEGRANGHGRDSFVGTLADVRLLSEAYPYLVSDMQAFVFEGQLQDRFDAVIPLFQTPNANPDWYLADLLEHRGLSFGAWQSVLAQRDAHQVSATQLRLYLSKAVLGE